MARHRSQSPSQTPLPDRAVARSAIALPAMALGILVGGIATLLYVEATSITGFAALQAWIKYACQ